MPLSLGVFIHFFVCSISSLLSFSMLFPYEYSWFYDSPLSYLGLKQVDELAQFLENTKSNKRGSKSEEEIIRILRCDPGAPSSTILCSNLRRAISTIAAGFRERLSRRPADRIFILSCLQEIRYVAAGVNAVYPKNTLRADFFLHFFIY